jgi:hypothetical protein
MTPRWSIPAWRFFPKTGLNLMREKEFILAIKTKNEYMGKGRK